ncbi:MAG: hypothetical protein AMJ75_06510 [Phycisphaerae bacterium SM1_79]|nr:MAG: hypothetical protein AMJ75_06510 [Phycisphaerae bacterium SM1_79]
MAFWAGFWYGGHKKQETIIPAGAVLSVVEGAGIHSVAGVTDDCFRREERTDSRGSGELVGQAPPYDNKRYAL